MILRSPAEDENGGLSLHPTWTPFPLMGKAGIGVLGNRSNQSPLPLSFPVKGQEGIRALPPVGFLDKSAISAPPTPIFK
jgi:hypothetical protein